ncbi:MAG: hypothetical protein N5P05_003792 [Chroococcopsis gigantea SAG 12.99]|jgi:hypothetical protein|nr:hypothetical protein [Chlorogloea purpurea SAG 13.99]MDV3002186.1 hypothetical protein [Chroococcopsis gigantea SAG 12.99]
MPNSRGVLYVAIGAKYAQEALVSARSVKQHLPGLEIAMFTNHPPIDTGGIFDRIIPLETIHPKPHINKLIGMMNSPFAETLFLDTDTFVCGGLSELFELLDNFDMAMAHDRGYYETFPDNTGLPDVFPEFNQGVVVFRQSPQLKEVFEQALQWTETLEARTGVYSHDQPPLRIAIYLSEIRFAVLTQEFNCRFHSFGYLNGMVKILHGRIPGQLNTELNMSVIASKINKETIPRVFVGGEVYVLGRKQFFSKSYNFSKRLTTLFHPTLAFYKTIFNRVRFIYAEQGLNGFSGLLHKFKKIP